MKISAIILLISIPIVTFAQDFQNMNKEDMQKMMQQMQEMESCMAKIDKAKLKALEQRSKQVNAEVKSLCANGKREKAQAKALSFSKEVVKDPTVQAVRKCGEKMKGMMPTIPLMDQHKASSSHHICD